MSAIEGTVGNNRFGVAEGVSDEIRLGKTGEISVGTVHAEHYEAASRGSVFYACTAVTGVAPGTSLSTTAAFWLHNPIGSGRNLVLLAASLGYISGTFGAGTVFLTTHAGVAVANPTGTAITPRTTLLGGSAVGVGLAFTTATVTTQIAIRPLFILGASLATTVYSPFSVKDQINGEVIVAPGFGVGIHAVAAAGTSPLVTYGVTWEEVPIS